VKIGVLLSGCGVYDGAEIHEAVLSLLAIDEIGAQALCISINAPQHHVINHSTGEEMNEQRNMLIEAARISRGTISTIDDVNPMDLDALVIPGGFGSAKNFTSWAFSGPEGSIRNDVKSFLIQLIHHRKPLLALCVSPVVVAKALEGSGIIAHLAIGSKKDASPYTIEDFQKGLESIGATTEDRSTNEILIDHGHRIITAPCYMMEASISQVRSSIKIAMEALKDLCHG